MKTERRKYFKLANDIDRLADRLDEMQRHGITHIELSDETAANLAALHRLNTENHQPSEAQPALDATTVWALPDLDEKGNATCKICGKKQAPYFQACIECCHHSELEFTEDWRGSDDGSGLVMDVECEICGKNFGFSRDVLMREYKAVRRSVNDQA